MKREPLWDVIKENSSGSKDISTFAKNISSWSTSARGRDINEQTLNKALLYILYIDIYYMRPSVVVGMITLNSDWILQQSSPTSDGFSFLSRCDFNAKVAHPLLNTVGLWVPTAGPFQILLFSIDILTSFNIVIFVH